MTRNRSLKTALVALLTHALVALGVFQPAYAMDPIATTLALNAKKAATSAVQSNTLTNCGVVTVSTPCLNLAQTWSASGITFTGLKLNVTDTASATNSLLLDLQAGGVSKFSVLKNGQLDAQGSIRSLGGNIRINSDGSVLSFGTNSDVILNREAANILSLRNLTNPQTFRVYNTYTDSSNGEWAELMWSSNTAYLQSNQNGTGQIRNIGLNASGTTLVVTGAGAQAGIIQANRNTSSTGSPLFSSNIASVATSGIAMSLAAQPTINQSGTAGYTAFYINVLENTTGSGTKKLIDANVGGSNRFYVTSTGAGYFNDALQANGSIQVNGGAGKFSLGGDVNLIREGSNILGLQNAAAAQTLRLYNTYTDTTNYERGTITWNGTANKFIIQTEQAGTGTARSLQLGTNGSASIDLFTANTVRWSIQPNGHFYATADNTYDIGASGTNRPRSVYVGSNVVAGGLVYTQSKTFSLLPSCTGNTGARSMITDGTLAASGNFGAVAAGGGSNIVPVYCDGTSWRIG